MCIKFCDEIKKKKKKNSSIGKNMEELENKTLLILPVSFVFFAFSSIQCARVCKPLRARIFARREFLREILYKNIAIIAIQHSKIHFVDTFGDFSHTVE